MGHEELKNGSVFKWPFCLFPPFNNDFPAFIMMFSPVYAEVSRGKLVLFSHSLIAFYFVKHMENLREEMQIGNLPLIYALSVETVLCVLIECLFLSTCTWVFFFFF